MKKQIKQEWHQALPMPWDLHTVEKTQEQRLNKSGFHSFSFCMTCYSAKACKPVWGQPALTAGAFTAIWKTQQEEEGDTIMCHSLSTLASSSYTVVLAPCTLRVITGSGTNPTTKHTIVAEIILEVLTILAVHQQKGNG